MEFRSQSNNSELPEVNLVPMLDVLMSVLTFFIILSMSLTGQREEGVILPQVGRAGEGEQVAATQPEKLVIAITEQQDFLVQNQLLSEQQVLQEIQQFLQNNQQGEIIVKADKTLAYQDVYQLLQKMGEIGGNRVSLAIQ
ncbi:biopolymer transporter ExbD [Spirulina sp. CS-785/01]|uniref:ExbD/TolR family protein n=1 Tax=Spirulina sp. CS-785/01 TaxID=3021716 RepID=UPI00232F1132|nr:biopolymer transporter ExbD [Spirulina sp. CS-785/01]MDB9314399.1 biopolymer transporter ExbD [Spirulina sp. CS-785/01]